MIKEDIKPSWYITYTAVQVFISSTTIPVSFLNHLLLHIFWVNEWLSFPEITSWNSVQKQLTLFSYVSIFNLDLSAVHKLLPQKKLQCFVKSTIFVSISNRKSIERKVKFRTHLIAKNETARQDIKNKTDCLEKSRMPDKPSWTTHNFSTFPYFSHSIS